MESSKARAAADRRREATKLSRRWYHSKRWKLRRAAQLHRVRFCEECKRQGRSRIATTADHVIPHRENAKLFWEGELQSLCDHCHSGPKQREERRGFSDAIDAEGWPADPRHPFNLRSQAGRS